MSATITSPFTVPAGTLIVIDAALPFWSREAAARKAIAASSGPGVASASASSRRSASRGFMVVPSEDTARAMPAREQLSSAWIHCEGKSWTVVRSLPTGMIFAPPGHREAREANGPCTGRAARRQSEAEEERAMSYETPSCAYCPSTIRACRQGEAETRGPGFGPSKVDDEGIEAAGRAYVDPFVREVARASALVESEGYCRWTRVEEIVALAKRLGFTKLGVAARIRFVELPRARSARP